HPHVTVHDLLGLIDRYLEHLTLRTPPVAVVNHFRVTWHHTVFQVCHFAIEGNGLDSAMSLQQNGTALSFVAPAGLHAVITVFNVIEPSHSVFATQLIKCLQERSR